MLSKLKAYVSTPIQHLCIVAAVLSCATPAVASFAPAQSHYVGGVGIGMYLAAIYFWLHEEATA